MSEMYHAPFYADRDEFVRALALTRSEPTDDLGIWQPWAYFRLGMYRTVAALPIQPVDPKYIERHLLPFVISVAACGQRARAVDTLSLVPWDSVSKTLRLSIAKHLSFYLPVESLELAENSLGELPPTLRVLLLQRAGRMHEARAALEAAFSEGLAGRYPELHLYRTVLDVVPPAQQIEQVNRLLNAYRLPSLALLDPSRPLNPCNVWMPTPLSSCEGPQVTVLMTSFNAGARISSAIDSVLRQTYGNLELIVVDDASSDGTPEVIQAWMDRDPRVRMVRLRNNVGTYLAKSIGLRHARGEFVTCQDSDDWSHPLKLELQVVPLLRDEALIATTSCGVRVHDDGSINSSSHADLVHCNYSSLLFRKAKVLRETGTWDCGVRMSADTEFFWRLRLIYGPRSILQVREPLSLLSYRKGTLTTTQNDVGFRGERFPPSRLTYTESFNAWHIDCLRNGGMPQEGRDPAFWIDSRPYHAPEDMRVDAESARRALLESGLISS
ncbi:MAG: glycosyltransferase family 2 protein [Castellaniella sp.]|uniref:glycosyltransferase family 2 protein n=1 Tax=Castellaniella sp. TaxID=1955812 RepID=UPI003C746C5E